MSEKITMKEFLKDLAKKNIDIFKKVSIIKGEYTGELIMKINCNEGSVTDVRVNLEIR